VHFRLLYQERIHLGDGLNTEKYTRDVRVWIKNGWVNSISFDQYSS